ncbi:MAG TPA: GNAT family N-acetyltransferase [Pyrinomonadaceae bacterium]|nr:GNAT family N-acetyltransferase [Pyrinomonadaceae bacterium]
MEEITIRTATANDLDALLGFEQGVIEAERPFDVTLKDGAIHYYDLEGLIAASNVELVVAELNGEVVGSGYARIEESKPYLKHDQHAYLGFMYTVPEHRGKGVNKTVMKALEQWSISKGIMEMRLEVYTNNLAAIKAYEKAGFTEHMLEMRLDLGKQEA